MKCPNCPDATLVMADRQGVEIDYCPHCRGVWLDRGELDKLIERAGAAPASHAAARTARPDFRDSDGYSSAGHGGRRRKSWLQDIFD
jgi:Zn-finger nucleic acid-binding protein